MEFVPGITLLGAGGHDFPLLTTIAAAFAVAWVLGLITHRLKLSPIVGYLLAGVVIGPYTPGFIGDVHLAQQLAEVGVILLMFGVGLHFHLKDLLAVRRVAIPGAVGQSLVATVATVALFQAFDWPIRSAVVLGMAMAVASTVVLLRVLMDRGMLTTTHGHVAVGWLIVEDIFTVLALVLVPLMAAPEDGSGSTGAGWMGIVWAVVKLGALVAIVLLAGSRVIPWILTQVAKLRSSELFTLTVLVLSVAIAVGSYQIFGASVALGAFLAGMVVAQSPASHQAAADALPMRDAFAVLFFVSVGMLFDPMFVISQPLLVAAGLGIVLVVKPLAAIAIVAVLGYPFRTALTVALGLAQIGEFSFILAQVAREHALVSEEGMHLLVATAMVSITLNPLVFGFIDPLERAARRWPWMWRIVNGRSEKQAALLNRAAEQHLAAAEKPIAIIVGYGPVGRLVDAVLRDAEMETVVIEMNIDTVASLAKSKHAAIFGDATRREVLDQAGVRRAVHMVVTLPHTGGRSDLVLAAREMNPSIHITVRARYLAEREGLEQAGANRVVFEEGEAGIALARHVMEHHGVKQAQVGQLLTAVRKIWKLEETPAARRAE
ncbi:MAG: putative cation/proton antiporter YbaL [Phycisphaerales bacterium]|nr:putative cation/proton antiporter YbaL [Phycisphaerales bacterium]